MTDTKIIPIYSPIDEESNISDKQNELLIPIKTYIADFARELNKDILKLRKKLLKKLKSLNFKNDVIINSIDNKDEYCDWYTQFENEKFEMLSEIDHIEYEKLTTELEKLFNYICIIHQHPIGMVEIKHRTVGRHIKLIWNIETDNICIQFEDYERYTFDGI